MTAESALRHVYRCGTLTIELTAATSISPYDAVVTDKSGSVVFSGNTGKVLAQWAAMEALEWCAGAESSGAVKDRFGWSLVRADR